MARGVLGGSKVCSRPMHALHTCEQRHTHLANECTTLSQQPCIGPGRRSPSTRRCEAGWPPTAWLLSPPRSTHYPRGPGAAPCPRARGLPATTCGPVAARCRLGMERLPVKASQTDPLGKVPALYMHFPGRCRHRKTHQRGTYEK